MGKDFKGSSRGLFEVVAPPFDREGLRKSSNKLVVGSNRATFRAGYFPNTSLYSVTTTSDCSITVTYCQSLVYVSHILLHVVAT